MFYEDRRPNGRNRLSRLHPRVTLELWQRAQPAMEIARSGRNVSRFRNCEIAYVRGPDRTPWEYARTAEYGGSQRTGRTMAQAARNAREMLHKSAMRPPCTAIVGKRSDS